MDGELANEEHVRRSIQMWVTIQARKIKCCKPLSIQDRHFLNVLHDAKSEHVSKTCKLVVWSKPPSGWLKLNYDWSCRNNPGTSEAGGLVLDEYGNLKGT